MIKRVIGLSIVATLALGGVSLAYENEKNFPMPSHMYNHRDHNIDNITEEDYQSMIDGMRENGFEDMDRMMEGMGRPGLCHGVKEQ